ncbi:uncharacterized protein C8Q71DRAFT_722679 [Rhodofomes roseus]|uniref:F-box domain-containing protein n=1 Tax=Rhodofomes roseus TaxID=34475 RepID=A0ABQ8KK48_9APHY|nr:uncharacterized protein C8Q71DRAFT_722679 [Rhodofomes roseus]KAH9838524.1 hypothetical protein C8Q71DRAFT_722679 [Rhodofomes roseus]
MYSSAASDYSGRRGGRSRGMPLPELPIEIQEQVLDHLHDDRRALRACSLVCSAWISTARLHLFRVVDLHRARDCLRFLAVLESTSNGYGIRAGVGRLVRELRLPTMTFDQRGRKEGQRFDLLCQILRRLPNVELLNMERFDWFTFAELLAGPGEDRANADLRDAFASVFPFPRLTTLLLRSMRPRNHPEALQLISAFPSLTSVELVQITGSQFSEDDEPVAVSYHGGPRVCIRELVVDRWSSSPPALRKILEGLLRPPFDLRLRKLQWKTSAADETSNHSDGPVLTEMFRGAADTLEKFELDILRDDWLEKNDVSRHRALTDVVLTFGFTRYYSCHWPAVPRFIAQLNSGALREVQLRFEDLHARFHWEFLPWQEMTDALRTLHQRHPSVVVTFTFLFRVRLGQLEPAPFVVEPLRALIRPVLKAGMRVAVVRTGLMDSYKYNSSSPGAPDVTWSPVWSARTWLSA